MSEENDSRSFRAYHGTDSNAYQSITRTGFKITALDDYLGQGAYFFGYGASPQPAKDAERWMKSPPRAHRGKPRTWVVMEAEISTEFLLDLNDPENLHVLNEIRELVYSNFARVKASGKGHGHDSVVDVDILNELRKQCKIHVVKRDMYIKFKREVQHEIRSRIPNVCLVCVYDLSAITKSRFHDHGNL